MFIRTVVGPLKPGGDEKRTYQSLRSPPLTSAHLTHRVKHSSAERTRASVQPVLFGQFVVFQTLASDVVEIYDGPSADSALLSSIHGSHSGETLPLSSGNKITLRFTTAGEQTAKGFHFVYQAPEAKRLRCWIQMKQGGLVGWWVGEVVGVVGGGVVAIADEAGASVANGLAGGWRMEDGGRRMPGGRCSAGKPRDGLASDIIGSHGREPMIDTCQRLRNRIIKQRVEVEVERPRVPQPHRVFSAFRVMKPRKQKARSARCDAAAAAAATAAPA
ncbi:hypothetical protein CRUP_000117 [Coryphaenoides rupestris]|nr:hypothetical protein CRUP_000117 [Coryphaenoides rupestris]